MRRHRSWELRLPDVSTMTVGFTVVLSQNTPYTTRLLDKRAPKFRARMATEIIVARMIVLEESVQYFIQQCQPIPESVGVTWLGEKKKIHSQEQDNRTRSPIRDYCWGILNGISFALGSLDRTPQQTQFLPTSWEAGPVG